MIVPIIFNIVVFTVLVCFFRRDNNKTNESLRLAWRSFQKIFPLLIIVILVLLFIQKLFSYEGIITEISANPGLKGYVLAALLGAIVHIPEFITFPIAGQLLSSGVNPGFIGVLITSLIMVHSFSLPIEIKEMGWRFALVRNSLGLVAAILVGAIIGVVY
ncbi:permease [Candidatus Woesearchaeota archaeon]|nr:permease [Candidatus Woesearchaeota archaeon]